MEQQFDSMNVYRDRGGQVIHNLCIFSCHMRIDYVIRPVAEPFCPRRPTAQTRP